MSGRAAVFLDRDGTLIAEREYLSDPGGVVFLPGAVAALAVLQQSGFALVLVTNQSGIGRGRYGVTAFQAVQERIERELAAAGIRLDGVYYCPHAPEDGCDCRKPGLALFLRAANELGVDLPASVWIGDRLRDVEPAAAFGGRAILVRTGYGDQEAVRAAAGVEVAADLAGAAERLVEG